MAWHHRKSIVIMLVLAVVAAACSVGSELDATDMVTQLPATTVPIPEVTSVPEARLGPDGTLYPDPVEPGRPSLVNPDDEVAQAVVTEVSLLRYETFSRPYPAGPLKVAGVVTESVGPIALAPSMCLGAEARFARANRASELDRFIEYVGCADDGGDEFRNAQLIAEFVEDRGAVAIVPSSSSAFFAGDYLQSSQILSVGRGDLPDYCGLDRSFSFAVGGVQGCPALAATATPVVALPVLQMFAEATGTDATQLRVVVVRSNEIAAQLFAESVHLEASTSGAEMAEDLVALPSAAANPLQQWDKLAGQIVDSGADLVIIHGQRTEGLYVALASVFDGEIVGTGFGNPDRLAQDSDVVTALSGSYQMVAGYDPTRIGGPAYNRFTLDVFAVGGDETNLTFGAMQGYVAADLYVQGLVDTLATQGELSAVTIHDTMNNSWQYVGLDEVACGGWWPVSHLVSQPCGSLVMVSGSGGALLSALALADYPLVVQTAAEAEALAADE